MSLTRTEAVILRTTNFSDTSRVYRLFTADFGPQSVIAKGVRRPRHRLTGVLEFLNHVEVLYYRRPGRTLFTLSQASPIDTFPGLATDVHRYYRAAVVAEVVLRLATAEERSDALLRVLVRTLGLLSRRPLPSLGERMFVAVWEILGLLGYSPRVGFCVVCDAPSNGAGPSRFSVADGGVVCARCGGGGRTVPLSSNLRRVIAGGGSSRPSGLTAEEEAILTDLTGEYIRYHVHDRRPIASWAFLRALGEGVP